MNPILITPTIYNCLYRPNFQDGQGGTGVFEYSHHIPAAPWLPHHLTRTAAPQHLVTLASAVLAQYAPIAVTDGAKTITATPLITALVVTSHRNQDVTARVFIQWRDDVSGAPLGGVQDAITLPDSLLQTHRAFLQTTQAAIPVSL